jgi:hypothetical protein
MGKNVFDVQQGNHLALYLGHAQYIFGIELHAKGRLVFYLVAADVEHFQHRIHDDADEDFAFAGGRADDDDTGALVVVGLLQLEAKAEVDNRNDFTAQIDNAFYKTGCFGDGCDLRNAMI